MNMLARFIFDNCRLNLLKLDLNSRKFLHWGIDPIKNLSMLFFMNSNIAPTSQWANKHTASRFKVKCILKKVVRLLQADQLFDFTTQEFRCTFCREIVEEDQSALPKKDSRLLLAKFNEQLEPLYILLREVEGIKLAPEILEPEPVDISTIRG